MVYGNNMEPFKKFGTAGVNFKSLLMKSMDTSYPLVIFFYEPTEGVGLIFFGMAWCFQHPSQEFMERMVAWNKQLLPSMNPLFPIVHYSFPGLFLEHPFCIYGLDP